MIVGCHDAIAAFQDFGHQLFQALFLHLHNQAQTKLSCKSRSFRQGGDFLAARTKSFQFFQVQLLHQPFAIAGPIYTLIVHQDEFAVAG